MKTASVSIKIFLNKNIKWVIEGCYSDLLHIVIKESNKVIFLNSGIETCITNCNSRPWEPHKYASIEEQNKNIEMLINWVSEYSTRNDEFSFNSHSKLYKEYSGEKEEFTSNQKIV